MPGDKNRNTIEDHQGSCRYIGEVSATSVELDVRSPQHFRACHFEQCPGPPLLAFRYAIYFRFARNGPYLGMSISLQPVTSLRRRAQANVPAASY